MNKMKTTVFSLMVAMVTPLPIAVAQQADSTFIFAGQKGKASLVAPVGILKRGEKVTFEVITTEQKDINNLKIVVVGAAGLHFGSKVYVTFSQEPVAFAGIVETTIDPATQKPKHKLLDIVGLPTTDRDVPFIAIYADGLPFDWRQGVSRRARSLEMRMLYNQLPANCQGVAVTKIEWAVAESGVVIDTKAVVGNRFITADVLTANSESRKLLLRATEIVCEGVGLINPKFKKSFSMNISWSSPNESILKELNMTN